MTDINSPAGGRATASLEAKEAGEARNLHLQLFKQYREYIQHEDGLINHRTTWLITIQSFLWATFGLSYQKRFEVTTRAKETLGHIELISVDLCRYDAFMMLLSVVGFCTAAVASCSVYAAVGAIRQLNKDWQAHPHGSHFPTLLPKLTGGGTKWSSPFGELIAIALPLVFALLWLTTFRFIYSSQALSGLWQRLLNAA